MRKAAPKGPARTDEALSVGGFLALWARDPDLAGLVFLQEAKPIADALFHRWRLAVDEAEDAVHDGLLRAYAHDEAALRRADPQVLFAAWLHGLIRNLAREVLRRKMAASGRGPRRDEGRTRRRTGRARTRETRLGRLPVKARLALTPKEREAFELYMQGLSTPRIAERLGIARESARERIARAWVAMAGAVAGIVPVKRSTLRDLAVGETKTFSPRVQKVHALWRSGASYTAIAETLGCTEAAARGLLQRLRRRLERTLPPSGR